MTMRKFLKDERGSAAVEFGIIAIAFVTVLMGVIEAGRLFLTWNGFQYAVETAAREATVDSTMTEDDIIELVEGQLGTFWMDFNDADLDVTFPVFNGITFVLIEGTFSYSTLVPFLPSEWSTIELPAQSRLVRS